MKTLNGNERGMKTGIKNRKKDVGTPKTEFLGNFRYFLKIKPVIIT